MLAHELFDKGGGIAATNDGGGTLFLAHKLSGDGGGGSVSRVFGVTEKTVPDDGVCVSNGICDFSHGNWADIEFVAF